VKDLDLRVENDQHDALGGQMTAQRANKDSVVIEARSVDPATLQVSVAVDPGDRSMAQIVQDKIADRLGARTGVTRTGFDTGSRVEGTYDQKLDACVAAARKAAEVLKLTNPQEEIHDTWAKVESRQTDAIPMTVRMERTPKDQTHVVFTAGTGPADDNRVLAARLKAEFERHLK
jgi:hypothetical protein